MAETTEKCRKPGCGALKLGPCFDFDCPQHYVPNAAHTIATLTDENERLLAALDAMRAERDAAFESAAKAICQGCREGDPINSNGFHQRGGFTYPCHSEALRAIATQEKPQGIPAGKEG